MYVKELYLHNIKSYQFSKFEFSPKINLLIGANNSGKTTILKCLQTLQNIVLGKEDVRKGNDHGSIFIKLDDVDVKNYAHLKAPSENQAQKNVDLLFSPGTNRAKQSYCNRYIIDKEWDTVHLDNSIKLDRKSINPSPEFKGFPNVENENNYIFYFLAKRKKNRYSSIANLDSMNGVIDDFSHLPSKIQILTNGSHPNSDKFNELCKDILGFKVGVTPGEGSNELRLSMYVNGDWVYVENMGEGVVNILGLLSILLTENNKLFLIEELENDIHPLALKKLLELIIQKSNNNQFIISTHSNIVLKYLASDVDTKIYYTHNEIENGTNLPTTTAKLIDNTPQERLDVLTKLGYDIFDFDPYKYYLILEESSAESIIREFLIPAFIPKLQYDLKTISARGVDNLEPVFNDFLRLFIYIHTNPVYQKNAWVIADGEASGLANITKLKEKFASWPQENFLNFTKANFEEYYPKEFLEKFNAIKETSKKQRQKLKQDLTIEVLNWINEDRERAKDEFSESAREVIQLLRNIEQRITVIARRSL